MNFGANLLLFSDICKLFFNFYAKVQRLPSLYLVEIVPNECEDKNMTITGLCPGENLEMYD